MNVSYFLIVSENWRTSELLSLLNINRKTKKIPCLDICDCLLYVSCSRSFLKCHRIVWVTVLKSSPELEFWSAESLCLREWWGQAPWLRQASWLPRGMARRQGWTLTHGQWGTWTNSWGWRSGLESVTRVSHNLLRSQWVRGDKPGLQWRQGVSLHIRLQVRGVWEQAQTQLQCSHNVAVEASMWKLHPVKGEGPPLHWGFLAWPRTPTGLGFRQQTPLKAHKGSQGPVNGGMALCAQFEVADQMFKTWVISVLQSRKLSVLKALHERYLGTSFSQKVPSSS